MKKILFENRALHSIHPSGVGRYARCLFQELQKKIAIQSIHLPFYLPKNSLLHLPEPMKFPKVKKGKVIVTFHDTFVMEEKNFFTEEFKLRLRKKFLYAMKNADRIIADSNYTRSRLLSHGCDENKIDVVWLAPTFPFSLRNTFREERNRKSILVLGNIEERKMPRQLLEIAKAASEFHFSIIGNIGYLEDSSTVDKLRALKNVSLLGYCSDEEVISILQNSLCLLYISYDEGFGIPLVEGMSFGTPVITVKNGSLNEIGGDSVLYVSPENVREVILQFQRLHEDKNYFEMYRRLGLERAKMFSWETTAMKTIEVYKKLEQSQ